MYEPLESQIAEAKEIVVSYDPTDPKIDSFVNGIEKMVKNGITCLANIRVNTNNSLNGIRLERKLEKIQKKFLVNEAVKGLAKFQSEADRKLSEISKICLGEK
jgi:hypothetical protein